jgi:hypothetical protein
VAISATDPITPAWGRMVQMLFKPFNLSKWFTLGFCAFLAFLGEGGGANFNVPGGGGGGGSGPRPAPAPFPGPGRVPGPGPGPAPGSSGGGNESFDTFVQQAKDFLASYGIVIALALLVVIALVVVLMWVRARGKFMFLEGVAYNRAAVVEPWKRLRPLANAFFRFELILTVLAFLSLGLVLVAAFLLALPDIRAETFGGGALTAIVAGGILLLVWAIGFGLVQAIAEDFLIPLMYLRGTGVGPAWREFRTAIVPGNAGSLVVFYLMRIVLGMAGAMAMTLGTCLTCCIGALPYVSSVLFLPVFVFNRSYSLYYLRQFGSQYNLLVEIAPSPVGGFPVTMPPDQQQPPQYPV